MSKLNKNEQEQIQEIFNIREDMDKWLSGEELKKEVENNVESRLKFLNERLRDVNKQTEFQSRKLETDEQGRLLLDPNNPEDVEWYENDAAYDIVPNEFTIDESGNMISKGKGSDVIY